ncbi:MAG: aminodeoxychorismate/anthranilate synthase component II [Lachnospiraceae bacterium]|nr:aminodeoxychorismate/anthranilate synthase component II [Lachnospiraceae bacterium]
MILLIDNYDSFSYNLYQLIGELNPDIRVVRNDELTVPEIADLGPERIVISPGPGRPADAGVCESVVQELGGRIPILGVCLGEQAICEAYGAVVDYAHRLMHGKQSIAALDGTSPIFAGLPEQIPVARYHSLAVRPATLPPELRVIATAEDGEVMAVEDRKKRVYGLQFHPESIMTPDGRKILQNFLNEEETS